jgi:hypothetical protein
VTTDFATEPTSFRLVSESGKGARLLTQPFPATAAGSFNVRVIELVSALPAPVATTTDSLNAFRPALRAALWIFRGGLARRDPQPDSLLFAALHPSLQQELQESELGARIQPVQSLGGLIGTSQSIIVQIRREFHCFDVLR